MVSVTIRNSTFENLTASKYGGVIYSNSLNSNNRILLENCKFINNHALIGDILYSLTKDSGPVISNIDEIKDIKGLLATNPTYIKLDDDSFKNLTIISGEKIPNGISGMIEISKLILFLLIN